MALEELLNKLIEKGWKPRGRKKTLHITIYDCDLNVYLDGGFMNEDIKSLRELVSKESLLWQFVCENGMLNIEYDITKSYKDSKSRTKHGGYNGDRYLEGYDMYNYKYLLIESALKDESELEEFLLDNIKVE